MTISAPQSVTVIHIVSPPSSPHDRVEGEDGAEGKEEDERWKMGYDPTMPRGKNEEAAREREKNMTEKGRGTGRKV